MEHREVAVNPNKHHFTTRTHRPLKTCKRKGWPSYSEREKTPSEETGHKIHSMSDRQAYSGGYISLLGARGGGLICTEKERSEERCQMGNTPFQTEREHSLRRNLESWALTSGRSTALTEDKAWCLTLVLRHRDRLQTPEFGSSLLHPQVTDGARDHGGFLSFEGPGFPWLLCTPSCIF